MRIFKFCLWMSFDFPSICPDTAGSAILVRYLLATFHIWCNCRLKQSAGLPHSLNAGQFLSEVRDGRFHWGNSISWTSPLSYLTPTACEWLQAHKFIPLNTKHEALRHRMSPSIVEASRFWGIHKDVEAFIPLDTKHKTFQRFVLGARWHEIMRLRPVTRYAWGGCLFPGGEWKSAQWKPSYT